MTLERFLAMALAGPVAGFLARLGVQEGAVAEGSSRKPSFYLAVGNPLLLNRRLRRRRQRRRLRRTVWLMSWVAGLLVLSSVGILGLWTALGQ